MRSRNWPAMMGRVKLKSKIFPASACAGSAIKKLLTATKAAGRTKAGSFAFLHATACHQRLCHACPCDALIAVRHRQTISKGGCQD